MILRSVYEQWTLDEVARRSHFSVRYLRTRFESVMGISPSEYLDNYQLHAALQLMRDSRLSLTQVADRSGFRSLAVFSRFITRRTGQAPSKLRRSLLCGKADLLSQNA